MMDNKTCRVDILSVSLGDEGYLIIPRETRDYVSRWSRPQMRWRGRWGTFRLMRRTRTGSHGCRQS